MDQKTLYEEIPLETIEKINEEMKKMAALDNRFRVIYAFFQELGEVDKSGYILVCRAKMPIVADTLIKMHPSLQDSTIMAAMRSPYKYNDADIVQLSAILLDMIIRSVKKALEDHEGIKNGG